MVFLDRDNTLIANDGDLGDPNAVVLLDGVPEGLVRLRDAGFVLVVVTNQGGVARGNYHEEDVDQVHAEIARLIDLKSGRKGVIDRFYYCPFHPDGKVEKYRGEHSWRKPQPGMLLQAAMDLDLDLESSWMIGDQPRDIEAGINAGCRTVQLGTPDSMSHQADASATPRYKKRGVQQLRNLDILSLWDPLLVRKDHFLSFRNYSAVTFSTVEFRVFVATKSSVKSEISTLC